MGTFQRWPPALQAILGFECFLITSPDADGKAAAAGTTTIRNPRYLLSKKKLTISLQLPRWIDGRPRRLLNSKPGPTRPISTQPRSSGASPADGRLQPPADVVARFRSSGGSAGASTESSDEGAASSLGFGASMVSSAHEVLLPSSSSDVLLEGSTTAHRKYLPAGVSAGILMITDSIDTLSPGGISPLLVVLPPSSNASS